MAKSVKPTAEQGASYDAADVAIARVLGAEQEARQAVELALLEVNRIAENARSAARLSSERTERRIRAVVGAFERDLTTRVAEIDAAAAQLDTPQPLTADELAALRRAVQALARELTGAQP